MVDHQFHYLLELMVVLYLYHWYEPSQATVTTSMNHQKAW